MADGIGDTSAVDDKVLATHPSVQNITQKMTGYQGFQFQSLQSFEVEKALQNRNIMAPEANCFNSFLRILENAISSEKKN